MGENRFKYKITADDETAKGVKSAEKGVSKLTGATKKYESAVAGARKASGARAYRSAAGQLHGAAG